MAYKKEDKEKFLEILASKSYHIGRACKAFDISRGTYYLWEKEDWFREKIEWLQEIDIDEAEDTLRILRKGIPNVSKDGKFIDWKVPPCKTSVIFFLKTKGKSRGYIETKEVITKPQTDLNDVSQETLDDLYDQLKED